MDTTAIEEQEGVEYITALGAVAAAPDLWGLKLAIHSLETVTKNMRHNRVERVSTKYTPEVLRQLVAEEIQWQIGSTREMRDAELQINDEQRARGTPYVERMKLINTRKIEWCDAEEARLRKLFSSFRVRPLSEWFDEVEYDAAKSMGMSWIIRTRLYSIAHG